MFWSKNKENIKKYSAKIRKIGIPLHTPVFLYKSGVQGGYTLHGHVFVMRKWQILLSLQNNHEYFVMSTPFENFLKKLFEKL